MFQTEKLLQIEAEVKNRETEIGLRDETIQRLDRERLKLLSDLNDQKLRLQHLVDHVKHFTPGENEHLIDKRGVKGYIPDVTPIIEGTDFWELYINWYLLSFFIETWIQSLVKI